jgi:hypothetical protein
MSDKLLLNFDLETWIDNKHDLSYFLSRQDNSDMIQQSKLYGGFEVPTLIRP